MWSDLSILLFGYVFILLSCGWVWMIGRMTSRFVLVGRITRLNCRDVKLIAVMMASWTAVWGLLTFTG